MPKYIVEALSQFRIVYAIDTDKKEWAEDTVTMEEAEEFGQMHLGEMIVSSREVDDDELIRIHDELNDYLKEWTREKKLSRVHKVEKK
jgi:hypothetical protein